ncbi:hypothetical protein SAMN05421756_103401 [Microlunatus flavus]|uniref:Uncharacterized protein n=1 Tax=Microlunatus flavus TaxID=1036181 RepID=A0A1H9FVL0_9ACTN|nr:hypothetical protein SAMN05421756_103401 [Microlunatus flavus]
MLPITSTLPGVTAKSGVMWAVLLFPEGEARYFLRSTVEVTEWEDA